MKKTRSSLYLELPQAPSLNRQLALAGSRNRIAYRRAKKAYTKKVAAVLKRAGIKRPRTPWKRWSLVSAHLRLWQKADPVDGRHPYLKWPIDSLVDLGFLEDDSPRHVVDVGPVTQEIYRESDRKTKAVILTIKKEKG